MPSHSCSVTMTSHNHHGQDTRPERRRAGWNYYWYFICHYAEFKFHGGWLCLSSLLRSALCGQRGKKKSYIYIYNQCIVCKYRKNTEVNQWTNKEENRLFNKAGCVANCWHGSLELCQLPVIPLDSLDGIRTDGGVWAFIKIKN